MRRLALVLLFACGCVTPRVGVIDLEAPTAAAVVIGDSSRPPELDALLEAVYGGALSLDEAESRTRALLARHPSSGPAHEAAAQLAWLRGDPHRAWWHSLRAAASLDGPTELYLAGAADSNTRAEEDATLPVLLEIMRRHARPEARAAAALLAASLLRRHGELERSRELVAPLGFVRDWLLVGPFDNDQGKGFLTVYAPETATAIDPAAELPGRIVPVRWRRVPRLSDLGAVELDDYVHPSDHSVAYLATFVHSDAARVVELRLTTSSPVRVWANDQLAASEELLGDGALDSVRVTLALAPGWNRVLVKSANRGARNWSFAARFTDEHGAPLALSASAEVHPPAAAAAAKTEPRVGYLPEGTDALAPPARRRFLTAALLARAGRPRDSLAAIQELLAERPDNLLATYHAALAYWSNDELGKTIDLLNQGVKATSSRAAGFLTKRGRYYSQKRLYDRAHHDFTAAIALGDRQLDAALELVDLYRQRGWVVEQCRALEELERKWPGAAHVQTQLGSCLEARGLDERAGQAWRRADELAPGNAFAIHSLFDLALRRGRLAEARELIAREQVLFPTAPGLFLSRGGLAYRRGATPEAAADYRAAAELCPGWSRPRELLGNLEFEAGREADALAAWRRALDLDPNLSGLAQRVERIAPTRFGAIEAFVPTDEDIDRALNARLTARPGAESALRLDHEVTEINSDGSARRVVTQVAEALNEHGRDSMTMSRLPGWGQLKILQAYALSKHGERQEASSIRGNEVRFRNLDIGSKVVTQYIHYSPSERILPNHYAQNWKFQNLAVQFEESHWIVLVKKGRTLNVEIDGEVAHQTRVEGDYVVHSFSASQVPPLMQEPLMPPPSDIGRMVSISTVPSWDDYVRWERALLDDALHADRKLDELAARLTADAKGPREKLDQLYHYTTQDIRYQQDYETTIAGVHPHAPSAVIERGYGDCKDKALLLIQLAKRAGVQARFAILRTTGVGRFRREVPNQQFNHAIVYVPAQAGIDQAMFLDPTANDLDMGELRADDQGATSLVLDVDSGKWEFLAIPYRSPEENKESHRVSIQVKSPTEASSTDQMVATGMVGMILRRVLHNPGTAKKLLAGFASQLFSGATLHDMQATNDGDIWHPVQLKLELDFSNALQSQGDRWRFAPPGSFPLDKTAALQHRETPIWLGPPSATEYVIDVTLPAGYQVVRLPADLTEKNKCFSFTRRSHDSAGGAQVTVEFERTCPLIPVAEYGDFREAVQRASRQYQDEIVFAKAIAPAPIKPAAAKHR